MTPDAVSHVHAEIAAQYLDDSGGPNVGSTNQGTTTTGTTEFSTISQKNDYISTSFNKLD